MKQRMILLSPQDMPRQWYNIQADIALNTPLGPDGQPISPDMLAPVFPMNLIEQEKVIVVNFSGHGLLDLAGYENYIAGKMTNLEFDESNLERVKLLLKDYPKPQRGKR